ncbi:hypothetical protein SAMN05216582_103136 [Selenomonas ruminantium]|uniref:Autotransporter domain-containing protein n=1 Tax=Selenomonas ruminantium TaxID=971 RepID=A0A1M6S601_SELRU|nr:autotransporter outer membrane beta-barrel domain-containing protein [Selenomonas ruminantium]SHK40212.1 hypothetical protein SAMN05216582_103136 [Selenomonas ruminantium]
MSTKVFRGGTRSGDQRKVSAALALAVAIYLSGGSLALAAETSGASGSSSSSSSSGTGAQKNVVILKDADNKVTITAIAPDGATLNPVANTTGVTSLTITGGTWDGWYVMGGGYSTAADVDGYSLTLDGVKSSGSNIAFITGGWSSNSTVSNNVLTLQGDTSVTVTQGIIGGLGQNTNNNKVNIAGGTVNVSHYTTTLSGLVGGLSYGGDAKGNGVMISAGKVESNAIAGGYAQEGTGNTVSENAAFITGGTVGASSPTALVGGFATGDSTTVQGNDAALFGGTLTGGVVGGAAMGSGATVTNNTAKVAGGTFTGGSNSYTGSYIPGAIVGGAAYNGASATGNTVLLVGGTISGYVMGGVANAASGSIAASTASGNTVEISGTASTLDLSSARIYGSAIYSAGSISTTGAGGNNTLKLASQGVSAYNIHNFQNIVVDFSQLSATPMLTLTMGETLLGGAAFTKTGELASPVIGATGLIYPVLKNANGISGMSAESENWVAAGSYNYRFTADSNTINAEIYKQGSNSSTVDAEVTGDVYGGRAMVGTSSSDANTLAITAKVNGNAYGGYSLGGDAKGNQVTITGTTVTGNVYGGYSGSNGATTGNVITLKNATVGGSVYGGSGSTYTGNLLNISGVNTVAGTVGNFETIVLAADTAWNPGSTVLTANKFTNIGALDISQAVNLQAAADAGSMTLLASGTANDFASLSLRYYDGKTAQLTADNPSQIVKTVNNGNTDFGNGTVYSSTTNHTVSLDTANSAKNVIYTVAAGSAVISLANWDGTAAAVTGVTGSNIAVNTGSFAIPAASEQVILTASTDNFFGEVTGERAYTSGAFSTDVANGVNLAGTKYGGVKKSDDGKVLTYYAETAQLGTVNLANWNGTDASAVTAGWKAADTIAVNTDNMSNLPQANANILTKNDTMDFTNAVVSGANAYTSAAAFSESEQGDGKTGSTTLMGTKTGGVRVTEDKAALEYVAEKRTVNTIALGQTAFAGGSTVLTRSGASYDYAGAKLDSSNLAVSFDSPLNAAAGDTMTLLTANETLPEFVMPQSLQESSYTNAALAAASGITLDGTIGGSLAQSGNSITYTVAANTATGLTFGDVEWKDSGAILDHSTTLSNVSFEGANVNTANIKFTNLEAQEAEKSTILVSGFGSTVGTITGDEYQVGSGLKGKGKASLVGNDLVFTTETRTGATEAAHNTVMGAAAALAALSAGNDFVGAATDGLGLAANTGSDGVAVYAKMGGGTSRQETGSHVDAHTWNAILAAGHKNEKDSGTMEYGAFFEYGTGNYATHNGAERGDGSMHYTGGGLLTKWQAPAGLYVEGSVRGGSVKDDAKNVMRDAAGNPYSYKTSAGYWGMHLGVGKEIALGTDSSLDVYGKYFFNRRQGVAFDAAGNHYDLDAVSSKVLRLGGRYTLKREHWNFYGGLAYEYEFGGEASGRVDGAAIRSADIGGGSVFGEIGAKLLPTDTSRWGLDINLTGFAGKKRGVSGGVSLAYMF